MREHIPTETTTITTVTTTKTPTTTTETPADTTETIFKMISNNPKVTAKEIASVCGITEDGVAYHIKKLKQSEMLNLWLADKILDALEGEDGLKLAAIETAKSKLTDGNL